MRNPDRRIHGREAALVQRKLSLRWPLSSDNPKMTFSYLTGHSPLLSIRWIESTGLPTKVGIVLPKGVLGPFSRCFPQPGSCKGEPLPVKLFHNGFSYAPCVAQRRGGFSARD